MRGEPGTPIQISPQHEALASTTGASVSTWRRPLTKRSLHALVDKVLASEERDRASMLGWAARRLGEHVAAGALTHQAAFDIVTATAAAAGLDKTAGEHGDC
jgi:hypothetical protein